MTAKVPPAPMFGSLEIAHGEPPAALRQREAELALEGAIERDLRLIADVGPRSGRSAIEKMGEIFRLTPGEIRVLHAVVEVGGIRDIAVALAVSPTTVKTHLRHIFQKTGTKGQVDLVRLVARAGSCSER